MPTHSLLCFFLAPATGWSVRSWLTVAGIPAALYAVQNMAALKGYQNLDALTFNVLNQTKTLSAALCCYLVMGRRQSPLQIVALVLLLIAALMMEGIIPIDRLFQPATILESETDSSRENDTDLAWDAYRFTNGVLPLLFASLISGLAGALSQKSLQAVHNARNSYLFSMELCAATVLILSGSLLFSRDGVAIAERGFWKNWTLRTWIPIVTGAGGGVLVGLVTTYAGAVRKGFPLIFGMLLSGLVQSIRDPEKGVSAGQICSGLLAAVSLYLHATNPAVDKKKVGEKEV